MENTNIDAVILNDNIFCPQTKESISIKKLNVGLSTFYGRKIEIRSDNIKDFEGDIIALCFGFTD